MKNTSKYQKFYAMQTFSEIQKDPKDGGKYVEIANSVVIFGQCTKYVNTKYRISANSFGGNYSFLNLALCTVTFDHST